jgi:hypothetical protein
MKGQLEITTRGVNEIHGEKVFSAATATQHEHGSWFHSVQDILDRVKELRQEEDFVSVTWITPDGDPVDPSGLYPLSLDQTKKGHPAIWEHGGGMSNTGGSHIVAGPSGEALSPIYIQRRGHLSCGTHALFPAKEGQHIIFANHHRQDFEIKVYQITEIYKSPVVCSDCAGDGTDRGDARHDRPCNPELPCPTCKGTGSARTALIALLAPIAQFDMGEWDEEPPQYLEAAIEAAKEKATCYHCREPHYAKEAVRTAFRQLKR